MFQYNKGFYGRCVLNSHAFPRTCVAYIEFVCRKLSVSYESGRFANEASKFASALNNKTAVCRIVFYNNLCAGFDGKLFCCNIIVAVADPVLNITFAAFVKHRRSEILFSVVGVGVCRNDR